MESVTICKSQSYGAEIKTVYGGMVAMLKTSVHQGMAASAAAANLSPAGSPVGTPLYWYSLLTPNLYGETGRQVLWTEGAALSDSSENKNNFTHRMINFVDR